MDVIFNDINDVYYNAGMVYAEPLIRKSDKEPLILDIPRRPAAPDSIKITVTTHQHQIGFNERRMSKLIK